MSAYESVFSFSLQHKSHMSTSMRIWMRTQMADIIRFGRFPCPISWLINVMWHLTIAHASSTNRNYYGQNIIVISGNRFNRFQAENLIIAEVEIELWIVVVLGVRILFIKIHRISPNTHPGCMVYHSSSNSFNFVCDFKFFLALSLSFFPPPAYTLIHKCKHLTPE